MQKYRYYLPPRSKLPFAAAFSPANALNTIYTLISMPTTTHYWDYWQLGLGILLCGFCFCSETGTPN